ncbi:hypothetical protein [Microbacterium sp.]|uniref:hypothetical protein n=1 Tax=Microbacterium sp. TaxID=51671 RepID=UPI0033405051
MSTSNSPGLSAVGGSTSQITASGDATWVPCPVALEGEVIAEQRSEGPGSIAVREKRLRPGPQ